VLGILSFGLILVPFVIGVALLILGQRVSRITATGAALAVTALATFCGLGLTAYIDQNIPFTLTWIPGTGTMTLPIGSTGLYAALVTTASAFLALLAALMQEDTARPSVTGVLLVTLAAANAAFLSGHFLGRYVALEIVGACVALVPLLALRNEDGSRLAKFVYLVLRIGDAGFLAAILILLRAGGTLDISEALASGLSLDARRLAWVVAGFLLAVWVKVGAWPFHGWLQTGRRFTLSSHTWTYATVMPNLGLYLLYRVTPLLVLNSSARQWVLWLGAASTLIAMIVALMQADFYDALTYVDAAQGGLALCAAADGLKPVVWLMLLVLTPLRLLLTLQRDRPLNAPALRSRHWTAVFTGVAGLLLTLLDAVLVWWLADNAAVPPVLRFTLNASVLLIGYRCLRASIRNLRKASSVEQRTWLCYAPSIMLSVLVLGAGVSFGPLLRSLSQVAHADFPPLPSVLVLARYWLFNPLLWLVAILIAIPERRQWIGAKLGVEAVTQTHDVERGVLTFARGVSTVVEVRFLEQVMVWVPREIAGSAAFLHRVVEEEGLEGLLRSVVRGAVATGHGLQRWHTGRLRVNLGWVAAILVLAVLVIVVRGW
jgi:NADH:ubiquinone oxidoreductase subunit 5 (subunit L)/multisubunit Na+/H+ antiporter MnhA subunit